MILLCLQLTEVLENPQNPLRIFHTSARSKHRNIPDCENGYTSMTTKTGETGKNSGTCETVEN